jgi:N6-adenosine-specific RNA methylase IME4
VLFLWVTVPKNPEGLQVMAAWGFTYKTGAVWDKVKLGMGHWFRSQHELILVGTKGTMSPPAEFLRIPSVIRAPGKEHSAKPEALMTYIESAYPGLSKLEMYSRTPRDGWAAWGNQGLAPAAQVAD